MQCRVACSHCHPSGKLSLLQSPSSPGVWAGEDGKVVGANLFLLYLQQIRKTQGVSFSAVRSMSHLRNGKLRHVISAPYNCLAKP